MSPWMCSAKNAEQEAMLCRMMMMMMMLLG